MLLLFSFKPVYSYGNAAGISPAGFLRAKALKREYEGSALMTLLRYPNAPPLDFKPPFAQQGDGFDQ